MVGALSAIDIAPVSNLRDDDHPGFIVDRVDDAMVADTNSEVASAAKLGAADWPRLGAQAVDRGLYPPAKGSMQSVICTNRFRMKSDLICWPRLLRYRGPQSRARLPQFPLAPGVLPGCPRETQGGQGAPRSDLRQLEPRPTYLALKRKEHRSPPSRSRVPVPAANEDLPPSQLLPPGKHTTNRRVHQRLPT